MSFLEVPSDWMSCDDSSRWSNPIASYFSIDDRLNIYLGDALEKLRNMKSSSVDCCVTSPPYWGLRDYGVEGQIGQESTPQEFIAKMVAIFAEVRRVLKPEGTCWINLGDSYAASATGSVTMASTLEGGKANQIEAGKRPSKLPKGWKPKDLIGIPWRTAIALQDEGWWLRQDIIWAKPNGMPGSQTDRCTSSHEHIFLLSKCASYWSDFDAIKTPPRESTRIRLSQNVQEQSGSHRANGGAKSNGTMKAVGSDKQRGHSRRHAGFNDRWDAMSVAEQQSMPATMRDVWFVSPGGFPDAHFAVMPIEIARRCILAGCPEGGTVLDPFNGSGTTGIAALKFGRKYVGIELKPDYADMSVKRFKDATAQEVLF